MINYTDYQPLHLVIEEIFSPLEGGVVGFNDRAEPIFEKVNFTYSMKKKYYSILDNTLNYTENFCKIFKDYLSLFEPSDLAAYIKLIKYSFTQSEYLEANMLSDIFFQDPSIFVYSNLAKKIYDNIKTENPFALTGFQSPENKFDILSLYNDSCQFKIAIHIHFFYIDIYSELLSLLINFPYKFDLILTTVTEANKNILQILFSHNILQNLNNLFIHIVPNQGRDVAPWLLYTKSYQNNYDLFCHLHTKKSFHMGNNFGMQWRQYLYKNLLDPHAVKIILNAFKNNDSLGVVFPEIFPPLKDFCILNHISQFGEFGEISIINKLCNQMGYQEEYLRSDLFFSEGTMFWYKTESLKKLFNINISLSDFSPEPIGVGGTLAHVIERLPAFVAKQGGYISRTITPFSAQNFPELFAKQHDDNLYLTNVLNNYKQTLKSLKWSITFLYLKYKLLTELTFGKKKCHYKNKKHLIKRILKELNT